VAGSGGADPDGAVRPSVLKRQRHYRKGPTLEQRRAVRDAVRKYHGLQEQIIAVNGQLLDLMDRRDDLLREAEKFSPLAMARELGISHSQVSYMLRLREDATVSDGTHRRRDRQ
jgi:hypothetical protein